MNNAPRQRASASPPPDHELVVTVEGGSKRYTIRASYDSADDREAAAQGVRELVKGWLRPERTRRGR